MKQKSQSLHIFEVLARQHEPMLTAYLLSLVADRSLAEDLAQQTLLIAYRKINTLKDPQAFAAWLRGIARLEAFAAIRRQGREVTMAPEVVQQMDEAYRRFEEEQPASSWEERFNLVEDCYRHLPESLQTVCRQHYFEDKKAWQIAESLTLNLNAVLKRLERARAAIRDCVHNKIADETN